MIYVDLLVLEDLFLNYIVLLSVSVLLGRNTNYKKVFLASVIGTIPLIFLFMDLSTILIFIINLIFSIIMSIISFKYNDIIYTIKNVLYMYFVSIFLAGTIYLINTTFLPQIDNAILNIIALITVSPIITYIHIKMIKKIKTDYSNYYKVDIYLKDKPKITINAFLDTGNRLIDPYTKKPIVLVDKHIIDAKNEKKLFVPYNTIDSHGLLTCFSPQKIYIHNLGFCHNVLIGITDEIPIEGADCILSQKVLERIIKYD